VLANRTDGHQQEHTDEDPERDKWERKMNDKRIELENDGKRWLIVAGM